MGSSDPTRQRCVVDPCGALRAATEQDMHLLKSDGGPYAGERGVHHYLRDRQRGTRDPAETEEDLQAPRTYRDRARHLPPETYRLVHRQRPSVLTTVVLLLRRNP